MHEEGLRSWEQQNVARILRSFWTNKSLLPELLSGDIPALVELDRILFRTYADCGVTLEPAALTYSRFAGDNSSLYCSSVRSTPINAGIEAAANGLECFLHLTACASEHGIGWHLEEVTHTPNKPDSTTAFSLCRSHSLADLGHALVYSGVLSILQLAETNLRSVCWAIEFAIDRHGLLKAQQLFFNHEGNVHQVLKLYIACNLHEWDHMPDAERFYSKRDVYHFLTLCHELELSNLRDHYRIKSYYDRTLLHAKARDLINELLKQTGVEAANPAAAESIRQLNRQCLEGLLTIPEFRLRRSLLLPTS